jgi:ankyrin repeat protein
VIEKLHQAASRGDIDELRRLAGSIPNLINTRDGYGDTALAYAARRGHEDVADWLLSHGADVSIVREKPNSGWSPLFWACGYGAKIEIVRKLIDAGADVRERADHHGAKQDTVLHQAAHYGHRVVIRLLIDRGADVAAVCGKGDAGYAGHTPLMVAAKEGHSSCAEELIGRGATVDVFSRTALGFWDDPELLDGDALASRDGNGAGVLHWSVYGNQREMIDLLIARGADPSAEDERGRTPLLEALLGGQPDLAASFRMDDERALALQGRVEELRGAIAKDADAVERQDASGWDLMHWAARGGDEATIELLLEAGADIEAVDVRGRTPLFTAAYDGRHEEAVGILVERGADVRHRDEAGRGILAYDVGREIGRFLRDRGAKE